MAFRRTNLINLIFFQVIGVFFCLPFCHAAAVYSDRSTWETAAGGSSDILEDFNTVSTDTALPVSLDSISLSITGGTRSTIDASPYIAPSDGIADDYLVNGTTYFLATTTRDSRTDEKITIIFNRPFISWGVDLNPHSGDLNDGVNFTTNSGESGTYYLPASDTTEFRGFVTQTPFTSITFSFNSNSVGNYAEAGWDNLSAHYAGGGITAGILYLLIQ